jgi:uncharacterized protein with HEPN domain
MKSPLRLADYLAHILEAISRIGEYTDGLDEVGFLKNRMAQDAVIRNLEVIGEACRNIRRHEPVAVESYPEVPWGFAVGMSNVLSHGYFKVDLEAVWKTVERDLPELARQIASLRESLSGNDP